MAIIRIQSANANTISGGVQTLTLGSNPIDGNNLYCITATPSSNQPTSITQTGATWTSLGTMSADAGFMTLWEACNVSGASTTISINTTAATLISFVIEFSGVESVDFDTRYGNFHVV